MKSLETKPYKKGLKNISPGPFSTCDKYSINLCKNPSELNHK